MPGANAQTRGTSPLINAPGSRASDARVPGAKNEGGGAAEADDVRAVCWRASTTSKGCVATAQATPAPTPHSSGRRAAAPKKR